MDTLRIQLRDNFVLRWTLANVIGWTLGLLIGLWNPLCFVIAGVVACICVGVAQWFILRPRYGKDWIIATIIGGICGTFPAMLAGVLALFGWGFLGICGGLIFGAAVGVGQWLILKRSTSRATWWIGANALGGLLCGTLMPIVPGLPIGLILGATVYGYITGRALERLLNPEVYGDVLPFDQT